MYWFIFHVNNSHTYYPWTASTETLPMTKFVCITNRMELVWSIQGKVNAFRIPINMLWCRFIPLSMNLEGNGSVSKVDLCERRVQECIRELDKDPDNFQLWLKYILIYEEMAENADSKKERVRKGKVRWRIDSYASNGIWTHSRCIEETTWPCQTDKCLIQCGYEGIWKNDVIDS